LTVLNGSEEEKEQEKEEHEEEKTEILYGVENAISRGVHFMQNAKKSMDLFGEKNGPSIIIEFPDIYKNNYIAAKKRGAKIRFITEITKDNIHYCKELMNIVTELRHLDGLIGGIAVSESEYMTTTTLRKKELLTQVFYSNAHEVVKQGQYVFDTFWNKAIPAKQRIKEIEQGVKREFINTIREPTEIWNLVQDLIESSTEELVILFSTAANAFRLRQEYKEFIELLKKAVAERNVIVRILADTDDPIKNMIENLRKEEGRKEQIINIEFRNKPRETRLTIMVVDNSYSLTIEMKDTTAKTFDEAIGLATYSNSESTVSSYLSIFETLWVQSELYGQKERESHR
jgi:sugar-specific transcriptional regulator TrmB